MTHELYLTATPEVLKYIKGKKQRIIKALRFLSKNGAYTNVVMRKEYYHGICNNLRRYVQNDGGPEIGVYDLPKYLFNQLPLNFEDNIFPLKDYDTEHGWEHRKKWCALFVKVLLNPTEKFKIPDELVETLQVRE